MGICILDICIVVGMQFFLESITRRRGGSTIMPKRGVASALANKAGSSTGAAIPTPTGTPGSSQRLSVLSQEEFLAAALTEHWAKLAIGVGFTIACRLPQYI